MKLNSIQYPIVLLDRLHPVVVKITLSKGSIPVHIALSYLRHTREHHYTRLCRKRREASPVPKRRKRIKPIIKPRLQSGLKFPKAMAESTPRLKMYGLRRRSSYRSKEPEKSRIESHIESTIDLESSSVSTRATKRKHRTRPEKSRIESHIESSIDLESSNVSTRATKRKHRTSSISQSINDAGSSVSTSSNGCSFVSSRTRRVHKEPSKRQPLAPLHYSFSTDDDSPMTPVPKVIVPRVRDATSTPNTSPHASPHASTLTALPTPRKRQHRFRLLRAKNVEWDETLISEKAESQHLTRLRAAGGKWRRKNARELVLQKAKQTEPVSWSDFLTGMTKENFVFLGEGDFSEVYCYSSGKISIAIKVMPAVGDDDKEAPAEIKGYSHYLPEIMASKLVTKLAYKFHENRTHGFAKLMGMYVVQGRLPTMLRSVRESATNIFEEDPFHDLPASQEWLVLKYPFVGKPLDSVDLIEVSPQAMRSIVAQVAVSLAAAERVYEFEHRDLHFGNILVQNVRFDRLRYRVDGQNFSVPSEGMMVTIIDFTLARVKDEDGEIYFVDLANDEEEEEEVVERGSFLDHLKVHYETKEMNRNRWNLYNPSSNIIWLKYLCNKFLHFLNALPMGERLRKRNDNTHNAIYSELQVLVESMSCFHSCSELVRANFFFDSFRKSKDDLY